jgi:two-component system chemotaxis response regulator CheB
LPIIKEIDIAPVLLRKTMSGHDIIVIGASAGGVETLSQLVGDLPKDLPAAIFIVVHFPRWGKSVLPDILNRKGDLPAAHATDSEVIVPGRIYVAPPDYHLVVKRGYIRLVQGPMENSCRPAVDPLFRTAAKAYGQRVIGVILSGTLDDGTAGLMDVKHYGGVAVVQDPKDALFSGMPSSAVENVKVDYVLPLSLIAPTLVQLAHEPVAKEGAKTVPSESEMEMEPDVVELDGAAMRSRGKRGTPSNFTCPDCGGTLYQLHERELLQFRCRVGHAFSVANLLAHQSEAQEEALWTAIRSLEERGELMRQMATKAREGHRTLSAQRFEAQAVEALQNADLIRQALYQGQLPATQEPAATQVETEGVEPNSPPHPLTTSPLKVVVLAASTGGLKVLSQILPALPPNFPAAIIVVQQLETRSSGRWMTDIVNYPNIMPLQYAQEGDGLRAGIIYIAPPQKHLLINPNGTFSLSQVAFVDFSPPPSVDLLLQSVAASFKERAIAVILTGTGNDGASGAQAIHKMGGKVIAQDESTSEFFEMPSATIQTGKVDLVVPSSAIASALVNLVMSQVAL